jgi:AraC family transcriptional regulator
MHSQLDHRLLVHVGPPARGFWQRHDVLYAGGDIDFIPAGLSETWEQHDAGTVVDIQLTRSLVRRAADDIGLDPDRVGQEPICQFRDPQIEHVARALDAERRMGYPSGLLYTDSLGLALAARLLSPGTPPATPNRGLSTAQLRRVTDFVEDHLDQDLSLVRLADVVGVSASHFKTLFRRSTGLPVHRYVIERRVERARKLLLEGALPAGQVAVMAGFSHQSHMARWMRRILGVTPTSLVRDSL